MSASAHIPITAHQLTLALEALKWTLRDLAAYSGLALSSIQRVHIQGERVRPTTSKKIRTAFEAHGVEFLGEYGVRYPRRDSRISDELVKTLTAQLRWAGHAAPDENAMFRLTHEKEGKTSLMLGVHVAEAERHFGA